jgi:hypothetical protein
MGASSRRRKRAAIRLLRGMFAATTGYRADTAAAMLDHPIDGAPPC